MPHIFHNLKAHFRNTESEEAPNKSIADLLAKLNGHEEAPDTFMEDLLDKLNTGRVDATTQKLEDIPPGFDLLLPGLCIEMRGSRLIYKIHKLPPASRSSFNKPDTSLYTIEADINRIQKLLSDVDSGFTPGGTWEMDVKNEIKSLREDIDCLDSAEMFWSTKEIVIDITSKLIKELVPKGIDCSQIRTALTRILFREYREGYPPYEGTKSIGTL